GFDPAHAPHSVGEPAPSPETPDALIDAVRALSPSARRAWRWIAARPRFARNAALIDILDEGSKDWRTPERTNALISMMTARQQRTLRGLIMSGDRHVGAAFCRVRTENGDRVQRFEARFDGLAGCLRTPAGGSSRQYVIEIEDGAVRTRFLSPREAARLMGLPETYRLPASATAALKLCGDGVSVPVVSWIERAVLTPALEGVRMAA
ncbi:MAG: DNA cytosine methyltransferase, partial [Pseudomonadota bacterium]